ncbi:MAG: hypothetical protein AB1894_25870 [Chloroflexota bacterium]
MSENFKHLGIYSDIVDEATWQDLLHKRAHPGAETQQKVREVLGWCERAEAAQEVRSERSWEQDGLSCEEVSWRCGYGPRTRAWVFKPSGAQGRLPGVLALHDHGGAKYHGIEKIADGPEETSAFIYNKRKALYGGRAWVNALAKEGFVVMVHDVFLWGSRRFPLADMQAALQAEAPEKILEEAWQSYAAPAEVAAYDYLSRQHEHVVAKYLNLLGATLAGVVCYEDRVALNVLRARPDVRADQVACMGLSGGGARAGLLRATVADLAAAVVAGMMSTYASLLDQNVACHTWMFFPTGWSRYGDWTDLVACQAPAELLVQYNLDDELFPLAGMRAAHARLQEHYQYAGRPQAYEGQFYPGAHKLDMEMQAAAFQWLRERIG